IRVLLIDLDPQANLTRGLGFDASPSKMSDTNAVLAGTGSILETRIVASWKYNKDLLLLRSGLDLSGATLRLASAYRRESLLADALETYSKTSEAPDLVLIDCPPSLDLLTLNALQAA